MRANIFGETITAVGIMFLGAFLFITLKETERKTSSCCPGISTSQATLLAASRIPGFFAPTHQSGIGDSGTPCILADTRKSGI